MQCCSYEYSGGGMHGNGNNHGRAHDHGHGGGSRHHYDLAS